MKNKIFWIVLGLSLLSGCEGFLDEKPSKRIIVPTTIDDLYSILAHTDRMNRDINLGVLLSDDMFTTDQGYLAFINNFTRDAYKWKQEIYEVTGGNVFWNIPYAVIFHSNLIIETTETINPRNETDRADLRNLRGIALFHRASALSALLQFFAPPVITEMDLQKRAIPLKLNSDVNDHQGLAMIGEVYERVFLDLIEAESLLPQIQSTPIFPNKSAANGLMARLHLILGNYTQSLEYSQKIMDENYSLMKFEEIANDVTLPLSGFQYPIPVLNEEILYYGNGGSSQSFTSPLSYVNNELIDQYDDQDLRKHLYFTTSDESGNKNFVGHFTGNFQLFTGIALDEIYLINSESLARLNRGQEGLDILNSLLQTRYVSGSFSPINYESEEQALERILIERRKSLTFRGYLRWTDLRRFLKDPSWEGPQPREVMGETFSLGTDPDRYFITIPLNELELNPAL